MKNRYTDIAEIFKSFCDENRIRILEMLKDGEKCGYDLLEELSVTQPTLSHHMKLLCDAGITESRKDGKMTYYRISSDGRNNALKLLGEITEIKEEVNDIRKKRTAPEKPQKTRRIKETKNEAKAEAATKKEEVKSEPIKRTKSPDYWLL